MNRLVAELFEGSWNNPVRNLGIFLREFLDESSEDSVHKPSKFLGNIQHGFLAESCKNFKQIPARNQ